MPDNDLELKSVPFRDLSADFVGREKNSFILRHLCLFKLSIIQKNIEGGRFWTIGIQRNQSKQLIPGGAMHDGVDGGTDADVLSQGLS